VFKSAWLSSVVFLANDLTQKKYQIPTVEKVMNKSKVGRRDATEDFEREI